MNVKQQHDDRMAALIDRLKGKGCEKSYVAKNTKRFKRI